MTTKKADVCGVCGGDKAAHEGFAHEFDPEGVLRIKEVAPPKPPPVGVDVLLRLVLLDKGLITVEELKAKEATLRDEARRNAADTPH